MLAGLLAGPVVAQDVFRCGTERAVRYQQTACDDGRPLQATDARTDSQSHDARLRVQQQTQTAAALESTRHQRDRQPAPQAIVIGKRDSLEGPAASPPPKKPLGSRIHIVKRSKAAKAAAPPPPPKGNGTTQAR